jgi:hypothetical protein
VKEYVKPTLEYVELRTEERLSTGCTRADNDCNQKPGYTNKDS